ncbi:hypothetical protein BC567DRAFT_216101 [Phyllosticta citribraziliensis]
MAGVCRHLQALVSITKTETGATHPMLYPRDFDDCPAGLHKTADTKSILWFVRVLVVAITMIVRPHESILLVDESFALVANQKVFLLETDEVPMIEGTRTARTHVVEFCRSCSCQSLLSDLKLHWPGNASFPEVELTSGASPGKEDLAVDPAVSCLWRPQHVAVVARRVLKVAYGLSGHRLRY